MKPLDISALVKELARRAKIGNGQDYRHARERMRVRQEQMAKREGK